MFGRLLALVVAIAAVAVAAPRFAPGLLAGLVAPADDAVVTADAPAPTPVAPAPGYSHRAALRADQLGHFAADAVVNGRSLQMLVDTGASLVALTGPSARRLGIYPPADAFNLTMSTANGQVSAAPVTLSEIRIGDVTVRSVPAVVFAGEGLGVNLLGMTFLKRLTKFEVGGGQLVLVQ